MKKLIILSIAIFLFGFNRVSAQYTPDCSQAGLTLTNINIDGTTVSFDIYVQSLLPSSETCYTLRIANGQIVVNFNASAFSGPTFVVTPTSSELGNFFEGSLDPAISQTDNAVLSINQVSDIFYTSLLIPTVEGTPVRLATCNITGFQSGDPMLSLDFDPVSSSPPPIQAGGSEEPQPLDNLECKLDTYGDVSQGDNDLYSIALSEVPLPLELVKFEADKFGDRSSILQWQSAMEVNTSHFTIERSVEGRGVWVPVGEVKAQGNSNDLHNYEYIDKDVFLGWGRVNYLYRLKMVDLDGSFEYSNIETVNFGKVLTGGGIKTFPNPAKDGLHIQIANDITIQPTELEVYDVLGRMVHSQVIGEGADYTYIDFGAASIEAGSYIVQFLNGDELVSKEKFIVQQ